MALKNLSTLREEAIVSGLVTAEQFDIIVVPKRMISTRQNDDPDI
jgi:fumarate hydratase class II